MKRTVHICVAVLAMLAATSVLTSCSGGLSGFGMPGMGGVDIPQSYEEHLANEYKNLAAYEEEFMLHEDDSAHFKAKARRSLRQQNVEPDDPDSRDIPDSTRDELATARAMLLDALNTLMMPDNEALLAMAQTRYDCWLAHQEDFPEEDAYIACKAEFYRALALLTLPEEYNKVYSIYFDSGSIALHEDSKETIAEIAHMYEDTPFWDLVLKGYTDGKGDPNQNKVLSMRRAISVKNALAQHGIPLEEIEISAEGEAAIAEDDAEGLQGRRVDVRAWPSYVAHDKENLHLAPGWRHITH